MSHGYSMIIHSTYAAEAHMYIPRPKKPLEILLNILGVLLFIGILFGGLFLLISTAATSKRNETTPQPLPTLKRGDIVEAHGQLWIVFAFTDDLYLMGDIYDGNILAIGSKGVTTISRIIKTEDSAYCEAAKKLLEDK